MHGRLAQLGERRVRNAEVEGSNPLPSTNKPSKNPPKKDGRLAQWESACFTRKRSLVQSQQRPCVKYALHNSSLQAADRPLGETGKLALRSFCIAVGDMPEICKVLKVCIYLRYTGARYDTIPFEFLNEALAAQP